MFDHDRRGELRDAHLPCKALHPLGSLAKGGRPCIGGGVADLTLRMRST